MNNLKFILNKIYIYLKENIKDILNIFKKIKFRK